MLTLEGATQHAHCPETSLRVLQTDDVVLQWEIIIIKKKCVCGGGPLVINKGQEKRGVGRKAMPPADFLKFHSSNFSFSW